MCNERTGMCTGCETDDDCEEPEPLCDTDTGECKSCREHNKCVEPEPKCDPRTGRCTGCKKDQDCQFDPNESNPLCNTTTGRCTSCKETGCEEPTPDCNERTGKCTGCKTNEDCEDCESVESTEMSPIPQMCIKNICDKNTGRCRGCKDDDECEEPTPDCDLETGRCTGCETNDDCEEPEPDCDADTGHCTGCKDDDYCEEPRPECNKMTGRCTGCTDDSDCTKSKPKCNKQTGRCKMYKDVQLMISAFNVELGVDAAVEDVKGTMTYVEKEGDTPKRVAFRKYPAEGEAPSHCVNANFCEIWIDDGTPMPEGYSYDFRVNTKLTKGICSRFISFQMRNEKSVAHIWGLKQNGIYNVTVSADNHAAMRLGYQKGYLEYEKRLEGSHVSRSKTIEATRNRQKFKMNLPMWRMVDAGITRLDFIWKNETIQDLDLRLYGIHKDGSSVCRTNTGQKTEEQFGCPAVTFHT